jgi:hypothetical protein
MESVTTRIGTGGRYLETARAESPLEVTTMMRPAGGSMGSKKKHGCARQLLSFLDTEDEKISFS